MNPPSKTIALQVQAATMIACMFALCHSATAQPADSDQPNYRNGTDLVLPSDYRSWPFLGAGLGMTYEGEQGTPDQTNAPMFTQVFVNPSAYRYFTDTGTWPDGSTFVLEVRRSSDDDSIVTGGRYATDLAVLEAEVKDSRFADGWAFYAFGAGSEISDVASRLTGEAAEPCVVCHSDHAAVERTFVQFYPALLEIAREKGTAKPDFR